MLTHNDFTDVEADENEIGQPAVLPRTFEALRDLALRAEAGDESVQQQVQALIRFDPGNAWTILGGDLITRNQRTLVKRCAAGDEEQAQAIHQQVTLLRNDLAGPAATPLEKILVDRLLICWLQVQLCDHECLHTTDDDVKGADYKQRVRDRAHRRFLSAAKTLATVRKLAVPAIQVNIAEEQINLSG